MACSTSCPTPGAHRTYGECLRAKGLSTAAGETTKASGPTQRNDALTAKAAPKKREPCPGLHSTAQVRGYLRCTACRWVHIKGKWVPPEDEWFPCAVHAPRADLDCDYCTTTTNDMVRATTNPADLTGSNR